MSTKKAKYGVKDLERDLGGMTFGQMLESYRLGEEMSQKDLSECLGISPSSVCDLEKGRKIPTIARAKEIAGILGLSEKLWIQVAIQDQLFKVDLDYEVKLGEAS
jgi:transcriptional regulator with XRE-family HTH domain